MRDIQSFDAFSSSAKYMRCRHSHRWPCGASSSRRERKGIETAAANSGCLTFEAPFAALLAVTTLLRVHIAAAT
jgi:hypothetical protein